MASIPGASQPDLRSLLDFEQLRAFHWKPEKQVEISAKLLKEALDEAIGIRQQILELAFEGTWYAQREKERLLFDAEDALDRVRLTGVLVIGAFFSQSKDKDREKERNRRLDLVEQWLGFDRRGDGAKANEILAELRTLQTELKRTQVPFHWMVEFPEIFYAERPDPLDGGRRNVAAYVEAFVGNPPFAGGTKISSTNGRGYIDWICQITPGATGNVDLAAFFLRRAGALLGVAGVMGFVTTNSLTSGDSSAAGLAALTSLGYQLLGEVRPQQWPASGANVAHVAVVMRRVGANPRVEESKTGGLGLTQTYNLINDARCELEDIGELRRVHEEMDRAVLNAYGWTDIEVPSSCPKTDAECAAVKAFEDEVIDRLFALNAERAAQERATSNDQAKSATPHKPKKSAQSEPKGATKGSKQKSKKTTPQGQGSLF